MAKDQVIMAGGEADTYEEVLETAAGERTFLTTKGPLKDGDGQTIGLYGIARDISERKLNEERLRHSQEQLLLFIEHAPVSIAMFDREMNYLAYSLRWLQDYGRGYPNLLGRNHYQVNPDMPERWKTSLRQGLAGETLSNDSDHWLQADGSRHWLRWAVLPWRDTAGAIGGIIISAEDTTERESVTRALADSRARLAAIIDSAMDAIITLDGEQRISLFNPAAERIFGFKAVELIGEPIDRLIPEQFRQTHRQHMQRFGNATSASKTLLGELRALRSDGSEFPIEASISKVGVAGETIFTVILRDVGERRLADDALRASEERFRSLVEQAADGIFVSDAQGYYLDVNSAGCAMLGFPREELLGRNITDIIDPAEIPRLEPEVARFAGGAVVTSEWRFKRKDGSFFPGEVSGRQLSDGRLQAILRDVSERKRAEVELRYQLNIIRGITEKSTNAIFINDAAGRVTAVNPEALRLFGYSAEELVGQVAHDVLHHRHPDGRPYPMSECPLCHVYTSGETIRDHEAVFLRKDGSQVIVMGSNSAIEADGKQVGATLVLHDISALKQVERALREREDDLKRAQAVGHIGSWRLDMRRNELTWSEENHRIFEVPEGTQMTYEFFLSCVHPDDRAYVDRDWQAGLGGAPYDIEHRLLVDGKVKWVREKAELEFAADGKLLGGFGTTQDISEIKAAELELDMARTAAIEEKTRLETVMQTLPVGVAIVDGQGGNLHCNADYERIWRGPRPAVHSVEDYDAYKAWWTSSGEPVQPHEWASALAIASGELVANQPLRIQRFDGSFASVLNSAAPIRDAHGHIVGSAVVIQDITEIREAEQSLRESEERFQLAAEVGHFGTWDWDVPSGKVFWSRGHYEILGYREGEVTPSYQSWSERVHSEDRARVEAEIRRCMMEKIDYVAEFRVLWPDDSLHWMSARGRSDYDQDGNCTRMLGVMSDITSLKQAELALREADQRKDEFLAMLAHELRNPLAPIRNAAHVLGRLDLHQGDYAGDVRRGHAGPALGRVEIQAAIAAAVAAGLLVDPGRGRGDGHPGGGDLGLDAAVAGRAPTRKAAQVAVRGGAGRIRADRDHPVAGARDRDSGVARGQYSAGAAARGAEVRGIGATLDPGMEGHGRCARVVQPDGPPAAQQVAGGGRAQRQADLAGAVARHIGVGVDHDPHLAAGGGTRIDHPDLVRVVGRDPRAGGWAGAGGDHLDIQAVAARIPQIDEAPRVVVGQDLEIDVHLTGGRHRTGGMAVVVALVAGGLDDGAPVLLDQEQVQEQLDQAVAVVRAEVVAQAHIDHHRAPGRRRVLEDVAHGIDQVHRVAEGLVVARVDVDHDQVGVGRDPNVVVGAVAVAGLGAIPGGDAGDMGAVALAVVVRAYRGRGRRARQGGVDGGLEVLHAERIAGWGTFGAACGEILVPDRQDAGGAVDLAKHLVAVIDTGVDDADDHACPGVSGRGAVQGRGPDLGDAAGEFGGEGARGLDPDHVRDGRQIVDAVERQGAGGKTEAAIGMCLDRRGDQADRVQVGDRTRELHQYPDQAWRPRGVDLLGRVTLEFFERRIDLAHRSLPQDRGTGPCPVHDTAWPAAAPQPSLIGGRVWQVPARVQG